MKKIILTLLVLSISFSFYAQLTKGTFMPGINLNYNQLSIHSQDSSHGKNFSNSVSKRSNFSTSINFGYFIKNNIAIGVTSGFQTNKQTSENTNSLSNYKIDQKENVFNAGVFLRYYKMIKESKFGVFAQFQSLYSRGKSTNNQEGYNNSGYLYQSYYDEQKSNSYNFSINPGIVYFITNKIGVETTFGSIGYLIENDDNYSKTNKTGNSTIKGTYLDFSTATIHLGVNFYLGRTKKD